MCNRCESPATIFCQDMIPDEGYDAQGWETTAYHPGLIYAGCKQHPPIGATRRIEYPRGKE